MKARKKQIIVIHGGEPFETHAQYLSDLKKQKIDFERFIEPKRRGWKDTLGERLGPSFEVVYPEMPCSRWNGKYSEWKIWFEKMIPFIKDGGIFVGQSLGAMFLARYFSENVFPKKVRALYLLAGGHEKRRWGRPDYMGGFTLQSDLGLITKQAQDVWLYHSKDDFIVPFSHLKRFQKGLPAAHSVVFTRKGHFMINEFPEIVKALKSL